jgi:hypothetical protein
VQEVHRKPLLGYPDCPLRARARAAGLTIRIVLDGYKLGPRGGPWERFDTVEALAGRLDQLELRRRRCSNDG